MKDETGGIVIKELVELKPKIDSFLIDYSIEHKKAKGVEKITHNEYKDVLLNKICLRHSMNRIHGGDHKIGTYEINKITLSCFDDKIRI